MSFKFDDLQKEGLARAALVDSLILADEQGLCSTPELLWQPKADISWEEEAPFSANGYPHPEIRQLPFRPGFGGVFLERLHRDGQSPG